MAELSCAAPMTVEASSMSADCPQSTGDETALSCQPMCLAVQESLAVVAKPLPYTDARVALAPDTLPTRHIGPEPPPPRVG